MAETLELQQVICPSCKQVITSFSPFQAQVECPWCHNKAFNPLITARKIPVPERLIVFRTDEKQFEQSMVNALVETDYVPKDIFSAINPENVIKAYLPMFLYEGKYQSSWSCKVAFMDTQLGTNYDGSKLKEKKVKKFLPQNGTSQGNFSFLCLAYEGKDIPEELRTFASQFPYNTMASKEFDPELLNLENDSDLMTLALDSDTDVVWTKYGDKLVNELAEANALQQLAGEEIKDFRASNSYDLKHNGRYVLAPFWFVYYTYNNQKYYYLMDGLGENFSLNHPVDGEEVAFVKGKEKIKTITKWLWPLSLVIWWLFNFAAAFVFLIAWFVGKLIVNKVMDNQIKAHLEESKEIRRQAASHLG